MSLPSIRKMNDNVTFDEDLSQAIDTLRRGGVIVYPTDTVWGIGCDATNDAAVRRVYEIKRRADAKAMLVLADSMTMIERHVAHMPEIAYELIKAAVEPLTLIYDRGVGLAPSLLGPGGSIGIRLTRERYSAGLCRGLRHPVVSTSANISGEPSAPFFNMINREIIGAADYVSGWRRDDTVPRRPSTVIKVSGDFTVKILRK